jgi:hypothetical protein
MEGLAVLVVVMSWVFILRGVHYRQNIIHALLVLAAGADIIHELYTNRKIAKVTKLQI